MNATTARGRAIATQDQSIANNVAKIEEAKQRPTAIQAMAARLQMSPVNLQNTLRQTVFKNASDAEFAALIVVANEYRLNPLLKEIFAFPAKGGGITPYVSIDGWIRIINEHPQFDGIEFEDIEDEGGNLIAIECTIHRKDRNHAIKVTEYLDECQRSTEPWQKSPRRLLRHRSIMQCGRVAFGFTGISAEDDYEIVPYAPQVDAAQARLPSRAETVRHDAETGEIIEGNADQASLDADNEALQRMDHDTGHGARDDDAPAADKPRRGRPPKNKDQTSEAARPPAANAAEAPRPPAETPSEAAGNTGGEPDYQALVYRLTSQIDDATTIMDVNSIASQASRFPDDWNTIVTDAAAARKAEIRAAEAGAK